MESSDQLTRAGSERRLIRAARELIGTSCERGQKGVPSHVTAPPGYEFVRELHRGGQGVVYQAFQESTGRDVAIKFLRHGEVSTLTEQARLRREVQILAQLRHPSIVTIHDSGRVGGLDYFVMDYIEGRPINFFVSQEEPSQGEMVVLFMRIAEAVQSAHLRGVIHRDLKPANILVDTTGVPHVVDFGLAKLSDSSNDATMLTQDGQFIGSLFWTAPEQACGRHDEVDVRTDVYSLGVVFWQALTGGFPYKISGDMAGTLQNIIHAEPSKTTASRVRVSDELETILRKCLAKDPERRYQNAGELAEDLKNYLDGRPILARRENPWYVMSKSIRRYRAVFGLVMATFLLAVGSSIGLGVLYSRAERARQAAQYGEYRANLNAASAGLLPYDSGRAQINLELAHEDLRGWEWYFLKRISDESILTLRDRGVIPCGVAWTPDGSRILTGFFDGKIIVWDSQTGKRVQTIKGHRDAVFDITINGDGTLAASGSRDRTVRLWNLHDGSEKMELQAPERATDVDFSPDGRKITAAASYSKIAVVWDVETGEELLRLPPHRPFLQSIAFNRDASMIATGSTEQAGGQGEASIRLYNAETGVVLHEFPADSWGVKELAFSPNDQRLAASTTTRAIQIWNAADIASRPLRLTDIGNFVETLEFTNDAARLVSGGKDGLVHISDSFSGERIDTFRGHRGNINRIALSPDATRAVSTSMDGTIKVWNLNEHPGRRVLRGHSHSVECVTFSPDGKILVSGSGDGSLRVWDTSTWEVMRVLNVHDGPVRGASFSADGSVFASSNLEPDTPGLEGSIILWDADWNAEVLAERLPSVMKMSVRPDRRELVAALSNGQLRTWNLKTREVVPEKDPQKKIGAAAYSNDSRFLAATVIGDEAIIYDSHSRDVLKTLEIPFADSERYPQTVCFSPSDDYLVIGGRSGVTVIWRTDTWEQVGQIGESGDAQVRSLVFAPGGDRLFVGTTLGVTIVNTATWAGLLTIRDVSGVYSVAMSPDGNDLAASSSDGTVRIWSKDR